MALIKLDSSNYPFECIKELPVENEGHPDIPALKVGEFYSQMPDTDPKLWETTTYECILDEYGDGIQFAKAEFFRYFKKR